MQIKPLLLLLLLLHLSAQRGAPQPIQPPAPASLYFFLFLFFTTPLPIFAKFASSLTPSQWSPSPLLVLSRRDMGEVGPETGADVAQRWPAFVSPGPCALSRCRRATGKGAPSCICASNARPCTPPLFLQRTRSDWCVHSGAYQAPSAGLRCAGSKLRELLRPLGFGRAHSRPGCSGQEISQPSGQHPAELFLFLEQLPAGSPRAFRLR